MFSRDDALLRTLKQKETRTAAHNLHEGRRLELTLEQLDQAWRRREQLMDLERRSLQRSISLEDRASWRSYEHGSGKWGRNQRAARSGLSSHELLTDTIQNTRPWSETRGVDFPHQPSRDLSLSPSCKFAPPGRAGNCPHFPCGYQPTIDKYNHLGLPDLLQGQEPKVGLTCKALLSARRQQALNKRIHTTDSHLPPLSSGSRRRLVEAVETTSVRRPLRSSQDSLSDRERTVRMVSKGKRDKLEKPVDWTVNYGNKFSLRRHIKAARPPKYA